VGPDILLSILFQKSAMNVESLKTQITETGYTNNHWCQLLFKDLNILPVPCMYISEIICHIKLHIEKWNKTQQFIIIMHAKS
jgi:hypothetical protein